MARQVDRPTTGDAAAVVAAVTGPVRAHGASPTQGVSPDHEGERGAVTESWLRRVHRVLWRRRGDLRWDVMIRTAGVLALLAIPLVLLAPSSIPLVAFGLISLPINGPLSPLLPTAWEPLIIQTAVYSGAWQVTLVGLCAYMYMEYINWYIYAWLFGRERLQSVRVHRWTQWAVRNFRRAPFGTVVFFAVAPMPFWVVRIIAILDGYSLTRFMIATTIGRVPRIFFYAWIGTTFRIPIVVLVIVGAGIPLALIGLRLMRGQRLMPGDEDLLSRRAEQRAPD